MLKVGREAFVLQLFLKNIFRKDMYGTSSNKHPGRLINFEDFRGVPWREASTEFLTEKIF